MAASTIQTINPFLQEKDTKTSSGCSVKSYSHDLGSGVILCMVHGYPQSSYMWRHIAPALKDKASLFIPELPGYGISSPPPSSDKRVIGKIILSALQSVMQDGETRPIIWCSHDRGARVGHRLLASAEPPADQIVAAVFMDIVPTLEQWRSFANPAASVAYFHWPFLATPTATEAILAMGGDHFCRLVLEKGKGGSDEAGVTRLQSGDAYDHYCALFAKEETVVGSCADYAEGSVPEAQAQERDQQEGRKVKVPLLVLFSEGSLAKMHGDVEAKWKPWVDGELTCIGVGGGHGHYFPESNPDTVVRHVLDFVKRVGV